MLLERSGPSCQSDRRSVPVPVTSPLRTVGKWRRAGYHSLLTPRYVEVRCSWYWSSQPLPRFLVCNILLVFLTIGVPVGIARVAAGSTIVLNASSGETAELRPGLMLNGSFSKQHVHFAHCRRLLALKGACDGMRNTIILSHNHAPSRKIIQTQNSLTKLQKNEPTSSHKQHSNCGDTGNVTVYIH